MRPHLTSNRVRRHHPDLELSRLAGVTGPPRITPAPPLAPEKPPRPLGELANAPASWIADLAAAHLAVERNGRTAFRRGMLWLLDALDALPGSTWQERWDAAGLNNPGRPVEELAGDDPDRRTRVNAAAQHAYCMRLIQPSTAAFTATRLSRYAILFRRVASDPLLEEFCERLERQPITKGAR